MNSSIVLFERFEATAGSRPGVLQMCGSPALDGGAVLSRVRRCSDLLGREGAAAGSLVLLHGMSGLSLVVGVLAVWSRDAAALVAEPSLADAEVMALRDEFAPACLLGCARGAWAVTRRLVDHRPPAALPRGTAVIKLTSGSTGRPRGIAVGAGHLLVDGRQIVDGLGIRPDDVNVGVIPPSHSYGLGNLIMPLVLQGSPLLLGEPLPTSLAQALSLEQPCVFPGVPALFEVLARLPEGGFTPGGLRLCLSAGAPLRPGTAATFRSRYGIPVRALYGASECGGIAYDASPEGRAAECDDAPVGTPLPGVEVRLSGEAGRVEVRSGAVAHGYLTGAESSGDGEFSEGWFRTGDTGRFDPLGRLVLTGRIGALVNVAGRKVNPREVESALLDVPGVEEAVVMAVPDASRGESLLACLVADGDLTREAVMRHLRGELAGYKLPRRMVFLPSIPRNERGKIDRGALLRAAAGPQPPEFSR